MKHLTTLLKYLLLILGLFLIVSGASERRYPPSLNHTDNSIPINEDTGEYTGNMQIVSLDETINLYGRVMNQQNDTDPLPDITIEVEGTNICSTTGKDGGFVLPNVPIKKQRLNFFDASNELICGADVYFNIDGGDICSYEKIIIDVGNRDGRLFTNMQIGFEIDLENRTLGYDEAKIQGNVETKENRIIYAVICFGFVLIFFISMIIIDKKQSSQNSIER